MDSGLNQIRANWVDFLQKQSIQVIKEDFQAVCLKNKDSRTQNEPSRVNTVVFCNWQPVELAKCLLCLQIPNSLQNLLYFLMSEVSFFRFETRYGWFVFLQNQGKF